MNETDRQVEQCPNGSFCCADMNTTCCDAGEGLWIDTTNYQLLNYDPSKTTISSSSSTTATSSSSSSTAPAVAQTTRPAAQSVTPKLSNTNTGAIAGGVVGGVAALAALLELLMFFHRKRKSQAQDHDNDAGNRRSLQKASGNYVPILGSQKAEKDGTELHEMDNNELQARNVELGGTPLVEEVGKT